jgi:fibro-slime domain-containing protein
MTHSTLAPHLVTVLGGPCGSSWPSLARRALPGSIVAAGAVLLGMGCAAGASDGDPSQGSEQGGVEGIVFPDLPAEEAAAPRQSGTSMPADFTAAERGGWKLAEPLAAEPGAARASRDDNRLDGCGSILTGVLRDVRESHPDFGGDVTNLRRGLVQEALGPEGKPVLAQGFRQGFIQSADSFRQWYEDVPGVNLPYALELYLQPNDGKFSFESHDFFPLDGEGFGNEAQQHNFSFTFELHTRFLYRGGEVFEFSGDDDLWVFINGQLAIDLGGVHSAAEQRIALDEAAGRLGIAPDNEYALDFFQAERHATQSNFQIDTTLQFTNCGSTTVLR